MPALFLIAICLSPNTTPGPPGFTKSDLFGFLREIKPRNELVFTKISRTTSFSQGLLGSWQGLKARLFKALTRGNSMFQPVGVTAALFFLLPFFFKRILDLRILFV